MSHQYNDNTNHQEMPVPVPPQRNDSEEVEFELAKATATASKKKTGSRKAKSASPRARAKHGSRQERSAKEKASRESEGWLTVDVYETDEDIVIESAIAGVAPKDVEIDATPDSLTIRGERKQSSKVKEENYLYQECYWGKFSRSIILPQEIDPKSAKAAFDNGILTVTLPKLDRGEKTKIKVQ